jgi:hypothetical protein
VTRYLLAGGSLAALMGAGLIPPVLVDRTESGAGQTTLGIGIVSVGYGLIVCGVMAVLVGFRQPVASGMPSGVRAAVAANIFILAFCALELSDRLMIGKLFYWTTFLLPPALVVFCGLLAAQRWAWWTARVVAAVGVLWFVGFVALIPFVDLRGEGGPGPWYGRIVMACISLGFAGISAGAFWSLGRPDARNYFGRIRTEGSEAA